MAQDGIEIEPKQSSAIDHDGIAAIERLRQAESMSKAPLRELDELIKLRQQYGIREDLELVDRVNTMIKKLLGM